MKMILMNVLILIGDRGQDGWRPDDSTHLHFTASMIHTETWGRSMLEWQTREHTGQTQKS